MKSFSLLRSTDILIGKFCNLAFSLKKPKITPKDYYAKILLIKLWGLGNLTVIWPLINRIKEKYPDSSIFFLTFGINRDFLERNKNIDRVIYFDFTENIVRIIARFFYLLAILRKEKLDLVVNFETFNNASALFSYLTGAPARIGLNNKYEKVMYTRWIQQDGSLHISGLFQNLLKPIGINSAYSYFCFEEAAQEKKTIDYILGKNGVENFICIHPGTSENFLHKRWGHKNFVELSNRLIEKYNLPLVFTGTQKEEGLVKGIIAQVSNKNKTVNLTSRLDIWEFIELLRRAALLISNDTGPVHIAAALGINLVSFYGLTSPARYGPLNKNSIVFYHNLNCSPCISADYRNPRCKNKFMCLDFSPREVFYKISGNFFNGQNRFN